MSNPNAPVSISERVRLARLSVDAQPFDPAAHKDHRSLYFTFSNGLPLTESQIFDFFPKHLMWLFGESPYDFGVERYYRSLVEEVSVPRQSGGRPPLHGKVVFKYATIPVKVMEGHEKVTFTIDGRPFCCRKFVSNKTQTATTASTSLPDGETHTGGEE